MKAAFAAFAALLAMAGPVAATEGFPGCLAELRKAAESRGIRADTFERALKGVAPDQSVLDLLDRQPEFSTPVRDYLGMLVDDKRVADGRRKLAAWGTVLRRIEERYGVDRHVVVAVWGVESNYGTILGRRPLLASLATVSCFGRRQAFFRGELLEALAIVQDGHVPLESLTGSWAGAFGHTQFMPSTFQRVAVDFDGDGRRDIVGSIPDALASTANYLDRSGWERGEPWGIEVRLPERYDGPSGRRNKRPLDAWAALGLERIDGQPISGDRPAGLLLPAGARGPAFLVFRNFDAVHAYNASEAYALAIVHLADRLRGGGRFRAAFPTDDQGLSRAERMELQEMLAARGYDVGAADGIIGPRTMEAIKAFQRAAGLPADGYADWRILHAVRSAPLS